MTTPAEARLIALALAEDGLDTALSGAVPTREPPAGTAGGDGAGAGGDLTSVATVSETALADAELVARRPGVLAGLDLAAAVFTAVDDAVTVTPRLEAGDSLAPGRVLAGVSGPARSVLAAERTALNVLGHLTGVASLTRRYAEALAGTGCVVRDTRKTLPGLRAAAKAAVVAGGGVNHRRGLADGLLVKDNHVAAAGGVTAATRLALAATDGLDVQVEVDDLAGLDEALAAGARAVLCDNFAPDDLAAAVSRCRREPDRVFVEASGGVTLENVAAVAATGVDAVAVGALTHSAPAVDVGLDLQRVREDAHGRAAGPAGEGP